MGGDASRLYVERMKDVPVTTRRAFVQAAAVGSLLVGVAGCRGRASSAPHQSELDPITNEEEENSVSAYLQISLKVSPSNREAAGAVFHKYRQPFLDTVPGAKTKNLLVREDDVQVQHGFETAQQANAYLESALFNNDVVGELGPLLDAAPEVRVYTVA